MGLAAWVLTPIFDRLPRWMSILVLGVLVFGIILSGSKMGWIVMIVILVVAIVLRWRDTELRNTLLGLGTASVIGLVLFVVVSPYARDRVQEAWKAAFTEHVDDNAETSSAVRRITWSAAEALILEHPVRGTGTGDIKNELLRVYGERGQFWAQEHRLNAHSQFLQSAACLGVGCGLLLVLMLLVPLCTPWRRDPIVLLFLLVCALNWSVESMLEVQAGVVWTAVMAFVLFRSSKGSPDVSAP